MHAFDNCTSLRSIIIPSSVVAIDGNPFCGCHADLFNESKAFVCEENVLFNKDKTTLISYRAKGTNYIIPDTVTSIGIYAFSGCKSLQSINIPNSVTNIGECAFFNCNSLTNINIPKSVTSVGEDAFSGCNSLRFGLRSEFIHRFGSKVYESWRL